MNNLSWLLPVEFLAAAVCILFLKKHIERKRALKAGGKSIDEELLPVKRRSLTISLLIIIFVICAVYTNRDKIFQKKHKPSGSLAGDKARQGPSEGNWVKIKAKTADGVAYESWLKKPQAASETKSDLTASDKLLKKLGLPTATEQKKTAAGLKSAF